jgi:hypothetical protein
MAADTRASPHSRSLSLHSRFGGPTNRETPDSKPKGSLLHRARRSVLSFNSPSPQAPHVSKRQQDDPQDRPDVKRTMPSSVAYSRTENALRLGPDKSPTMDSRPKNEDVFLNIARTDSGRRDSIGRSDFRRVSPTMNRSRSHSWRLWHSRPDLATSLLTKHSHGLDIPVRVYGHRQNKLPHPISDTAISTPCLRKMAPQPPPTPPSTRRPHQPIP